MPRLGHIASECPNRRVVALIEDEEVYEEEDEEAILYVDKRLSIMVQYYLRLASEKSKKGMLDHKR